MLPWWLNEFMHNKQLKEFLAYSVFKNTLVIMIIIFASNKTVYDFIYVLSASQIENPRKLFSKFFKTWIVVYFLWVRHS